MARVMITPKIPAKTFSTQAIRDARCARVWSPTKLASRTWKIKIPPRELLSHYIQKRERIDVDSAHNKDIDRPVVTCIVGYVSTPLRFKICTFVSL